MPEGFPDVDDEAEDGGEGGIVEGFFNVAQLPQSTYPPKKSDSDMHAAGFLRLRCRIPFCSFFYSTKTRDPEALSTTVILAHKHYKHQKL